MPSRYSCPDDADDDVGSEMQVNDDERELDAAADDEGDALPRAQRSLLSPQFKGSTKRSPLSGRTRKLVLPKPKSPARARYAEEEAAIRHDAEGTAEKVKRLFDEQQRKLETATRQEQDRLGM